MSDSKTDAGAADPALVQACDGIAAELHRRLERRNSTSLPRGTRIQIDGEVIGLLGALGIALGESVAGGIADAAGRAYYGAWLDRQNTTPKTTTADGVQA